MMRQKGAGDRRCRNEMKMRAGHKGKEWDIGWQKREIGRS